jgi:hypothetical protein
MLATIKSAAGEVSRAAVESAVGGMRRELDSQKAATREAREAAFWQAVNAAVPNWRELSQDKDFAAWMFAEDPVSGRIRQQIMDAAAAAFDSKRVVSIFNTWNQLQPRPAEARDASRRVLPNGKPPAAMPTEKPADSIVSRSWIAEQNRLFSQGYYRRRPKEWQQVQETIDRAAREGRIR